MIANDNPFESMMRIGFNGTVLATREIRGWSRYTTNLIERLVKKNCEVFIYSDRPLNTQFLPRNVNIREIPSRFNQ